MYLEYILCLYYIKRNVIIPSKAYIFKFKTSICYTYYSKNKYTYFKV